MNMVSTIHANVLHTTMLYERYGPAFFGFLCRHLVSREDAEDVQGEVFKAILEHPSFASWSEEAQRRWMWRVVRNKVVDVYRTSLRVEYVSLEEVCDHLTDDERETPEQMILQHETAIHLGEAMRRLPLWQQRLLKWRFADEMRCGEIADQLGKSEMAVRAQLSRTLKRLRRIYEEEKAQRSCEGECPSD
ncbi:hypothetical protein KSC_105600 [Ktedonobacter sp. SOSP1-52]|uniref:RNA polymerase sigma factor n=1 Tax=Ktedonobacter sp. SOSP1-52 TaxID=2778366 RepID=UPI001916C36B|nr:sigma-70 family RNA polymerase sigma factor [Ktedonobacter sp. SOSP1-52]GHO71668.1 hypothetical protein KSC_105600 [Ktedonobacter sp. SOSP1-52]